MTEDIETTVDYLKTFIFFRQLDNETLADLAKEGDLLAVKENACLVEKGEIFEKLYFVLSGKLIAHEHGDGPVEGAVGKNGRRSGDGSGKGSSGEAGVLADHAFIVRRYIQGDCFGDVELRKQHNGDSDGTRQSRTSRFSYVVEEHSQLFVLTVAQFERIIMPVLRVRGIVFPMASCYGALKRPSQERSDHDLPLILVSPAYTWLCPFCSRDRVCSSAQSVIDTIGSGIFSELTDLERLAEVLNDQHFFGPLTQVQKDAVCRAVTIVNVEANDVICEEDEEGECLYLLYYGSASVFVNHQTKREEIRFSSSDAADGGGGNTAPKDQATQQDLSAPRPGAIDAARAAPAAPQREDCSPFGVLINVMKKGDVFGEASLQTGRPHGTSVVAREKSELLRIDKADYDAILRLRDNRLAFRPNELARWVLALQKRAERIGPNDQVLVSLKRRVMNALLRPLPVFARMSAATFDKLIDDGIMRPETFLKDSGVYTATSPATFVAIIVVGSIEFYTSKNRDHCLLIAKQGDIVGNLEIVWDCPRLVGARPATDTFCMVLDRQHYEQYWRNVHDESLYTTAVALQDYPSLFSISPADQFQLFFAVQRRRLPRGTVFVAEDMRDEILIVLSGEQQLVLRKGKAKGLKGSLAVAVVGAKTVFGDLGLSHVDRSLALVVTTETEALILPKATLVPTPHVINALGAGLSHILAWSYSGNNPTTTSSRPSATSGLGRGMISTPRPSLPTAPSTGEWFPRSDPPLLPNQPISRTCGDAFIAVPESQMGAPGAPRRPQHQRPAPTSTVARVSLSSLYAAGNNSGGGGRRVKQAAPLRPAVPTRAQLSSTRRMVCPLKPAATYSRRFEYIAPRATTAAPVVGSSGGVLRGSSRQQRLVNLFA